MPEHRVRDYHYEDYPSVIRIWEETGMGGPERGDNDETIGRSISIGGRLLILENSEGNIVGTSWMTFDGRRIHLHHFGILKKYQGLGLSKLLLDKTLEHVKDTGYQVKLEVHKTNEIAISLYKKAGFSYLGDYLVFIIRDTDSI
jgi:ribosomal protein S18 acetylase RimI-like enzyme